MNRAHSLPAVAALLLFAAPAAAAEHRDVAGTNYVFVVGFASEPALAGAPNAFSLRATDVSKDGPVEGLDRMLSVDVKKDGSAKTLSFRRVRGSPGTYAADFVPTRAGSYTFVVHGTVGDRAIEDPFESGEGRFGDVLALDDIGFPPPAAPPEPTASAPVAPVAPVAPPRPEPSAPPPADLEAKLERAITRADAAEEKAHKSFVAALGALAAAALAAGAAALSARRNASR